MSTKVLHELLNDNEAREIVHRAARRDRRYGSGDNMDFALFVVDETRKAERERKRVSVARKKPIPTQCPHHPKCVRQKRHPGSCMDWRDNQLLRPA